MFVIGFKRIHDFDEILNTAQDIVFWAKEMQ